MGDAVGFLAFDENLAFSHFVSVSLFSVESYSI